MAHRERFLCPGCNVLGREHSYRVCDGCSRNVRMLSRIHTEIVRQMPALRSESLAMIVLRMWIRLNREKPELVKRARALFDDAMVSFAAEPEQEDLF